jgi:hypothetical protein
MGINATGLVDMLPTDLIDWFVDLSCSDCTPEIVTEIVTEIEIVEVEIACNVTELCPHITFNNETINETTDIVCEPDSVIEYITQYVNVTVPEYITEYITEYVNVTVEAECAACEECEVCEECEQQAEEEDDEWEECINCRAGEYTNIRDYFKPHLDNDTDTEEYDSDYYTGLDEFNPNVPLYPANEEYND